eukprot:6658843-Alexandrium_andersonii.AAC.1
MSASLVGSEMCIRDRRARPLTLNEDCGQGRPRPKERAPYADSRLMPVSYTHLTLPTICSV